ncbi:hypothetical protein BGZ61DRAFT_479481 [Ilyonectria robusta]|uniref:uncharacterized protein n=1 Tax=Ilyonectria robusta TaxID=1079257 RepID=UPI001E8E4630|nr:uncharacterized protein BGZ61DRAFT_479481 [Ilyonectria robusta]KAH8686373.1 hypothetical protein BGZ61DRAFT_479481 [Ilyonectria robusta]
MYPCSAKPIHMGPPHGQSFHAPPKDQTGWANFSEAVPSPGPPLPPWTQTPTTASSPASVSPIGTPRSGCASMIHLKLNTRKPPYPSWNTPSRHSVIQGGFCVGKNFPSEEIRLKSVTTLFDPPMSRTIPDNVFEAETTLATSCGCTSSSKLCGPCRLKQRNSNLRSENQSLRKALTKPWKDREKLSGYLKLDS